MNTPETIFEALDAASREKGFLFMEEFAKRHGCTEEDLENWSREDCNFEHTLIMAKTRICCNSKDKVNTGEIDLPTYDKIMKKYIKDLWPDEWAELEEAIERCQREEGTYVEG